MLILPALKHAPKIAPSPCRAQPQQQQVPSWGRRGCSQPPQPPSRWQTQRNSSCCYPVARCRAHLGWVGGWGAGGSTGGQARASPLPHVLPKIMLCPAPLGGVGCLRAVGARLPGGILRLLTKTIRSLYKDQREVVDDSHRMESWKCHLTLVSHNLGIRESDSITITFFSKKLISDYTSIGGSLKHGKLHFGLTH